MQTQNPNPENVEKNERVSWSLAQARSRAWLRTTQPTDADSLYSLAGCEVEKRNGSARAWLKQDPELGPGRPKQPMLTAYSSPNADANPSGRQHKAKHRRSVGRKFSRYRLTVGQLELGSSKIQSLAQDDRTNPHKTKTSASAKAAPEKKNADSKGLNYHLVGPTCCNGRKPMF